MQELKIYIADDDFDDRDFFMDALKSIDINTEVSQFDNGIDLMDRLFSDVTLPHVIFLDLYMPIMDGFECLMDIRNFQQFKDIYIIAYSSIYRDREVNQLKDEGANQFLRKSSSFKELKELLSKSLRKVLVNNDEAVLKNEFVVLL
ncbi:response regulator [Maribacter sp. BPC-D8]|uniref:response regulator n=1 Tax=Maribacter sp. BPC-D8 TaxID=3053613 RepID=UPI002B4A4709|nr:response regulator [Maribacter sp. BPC-D8]WRI29370.1 response regulator [Maribacter sp. BPC-D8]